MTNPLYWQAPHTACIIAHGLLVMTSFVLFGTAWIGSPFAPFLGFITGGLTISCNKEVFKRLQDLQRKDRTDLMEHRYFQAKMITIGSCAASVLIFAADCAVCSFYIYFGNDIEMAAVHWGYIFGAVVAVLAAITAAATIVGDLIMLREDRKHLQLLGSISLDEENGIDAIRYQDEVDGTGDGIDTTSYRDEVDGAADEPLGVADRAQA